MRIEFMDNDQIDEQNRKINSKQISDSDFEALIQNQINQRKFFITPKLVPCVLDFIATYKIANGSPIMIIGPTGVGKSLFTYIFHKLFQEEKRSNVNISTINCSFYGGDTVRSELFGHVKGIFTGATTETAGIFGSPTIGAVILEEIGDLPPQTQAQLLRFIETGEYHKLGDTKARTVKLQIIGVTNREEQLRDDFRHRFQKFYIPPLYERRQDVLYYIALKYPELFRELSPWETLSLMAYNWPGNVREVENIVGILQRLRYNESYAKRLHRSYAGFKYSFLFEIDKRYSELQGKQILNLITELEDWGVDIAFLDDYLNSYYFGIIPQKWGTGRGGGKPDRFLKEFSYKNIKSGYYNDQLGFYERFGLVSFSHYVWQYPFETLNKGFEKYCKLFFRNGNENVNLLQTKEGNFTFKPLFLPESSWYSQREIQNKFETKNMAKVLKLRKEIIEFLSGIKSLPDVREMDTQRSTGYFKKLVPVFPSNHFFASICGKAPEKETTEIKKIYDLTRNDLLKVYYKGLLERTGGVLANVVKIAGRPRSTIISELTRLGISYNEEKDD
jgi:DNA-binding NtrC family response regulator